MNARYAHAVSSAALVLRFVHVYPTVFARGFEKPHVLLAHGRESFEHKLERLLEGQL